MLSYCIQPVSWGKMWGAPSITENSPTMLSDVKVRAAKAREIRYRLHDADGLLLEVRPNGSKSWVLRYTEGGKRRDKALGRYPAMLLREARQAANDALLLIQRGEKPFVPPAPKNTFSQVGQAFLEEKTRKNVSNKVTIARWCYALSRV